MDSVLRAAAVYLILLIILRIAGKRTLAQVTVFDFILLLIIGEATQQALLGEDFSIINAAIVIGTLVLLDIGLSVLKQRSEALDRVIDDSPVVIVDHGKLLRDRMDRSRIDEQEILVAARELHGLERLEQIKFAVLERSGGISIVPAESSGKDS
ncbi:DUF421 domain-containing protein [Steroidobacter sp. S1-65]|uniref:DUF421 domain-containing protein n=1 Tax=Steroidobacter gossypii TaxID=2805490 RepID=A0ABS1X1A2_9GAMM|nr:YetF domain-containing protein [Steroidobacter gossypii]MBM0106987.1 DUF421 domain-containing protein [Steroidobacter gossypii]